MPTARASDDDFADTSRLRLAIQKSGRLSDGSIELLKSCGLTISRGRDKLYGRVEEMPIDILLLRDDDIPSFVADGACDIGIVGENVAEEETLTDARGASAQTVMALGFSRCRLMIAGPKDVDYTDHAMLAGKRIATSYPGLTRQFLAAHKIDAQPIMMKGSVEVAPRLRIADLVCDIVSTGATLDANGLKPYVKIFESEAILIRHEKEFSVDKQSTFESLLKRIQGVMRSRDAKYVMMNAPRQAIEAITDKLPGVDAPTVLNLAGRDDMVAIHAVCPEAVFWDTLEELKSLGASGILVLNIEKMMT
ncbi:MAG: ATP phosphoribosyltransferase [Pseudomonadota bacterium]